MPDRVRSLTQSRAARARVQSSTLERLFGEGEGERMAFAPGRVNLIGEHTDYNDLPVLPMAIQSDTALLFRASGSRRVRLGNVDERFGPREFELSEEIERYGPGDWGNYAKAAAQALVRRFGELSGIDGVVAGDVPPAAGLSSSAALVVTCALALCAANGIEAEPLELAELLARGEHYVGTRSGGMDQAICLLGRRDTALKIDFAPLRVEPLPVPPQWRFVVAHSGVRADKSGALQRAYNERRAQCAEALARLAELPELARTAQSYPALLGAHSPVELLALAEPALEPALLARFRHQVGEVQRVEAARGALLAGDERNFGRKMNESHESLRDDYEVSHPALDELVDLARDAGASGARMTGAGFGGCIVALCDAGRADALVEALERDYYRPRRAEPKVLVAVASDGARVE